MDSYQKLVFSICYKMTADYFAAEDLAQETFLSAYEHSDLSVRGYFPLRDFLNNWEDFIYKIFLYDFTHW